MPCDGSVSIAGMDVVDPKTRSRMMRAVRSKNTSPELVVRRTAHAMGYRFRLHRRDLPGCPDLVFPGRKTAVFVHGCFWHAHGGCPRATLPTSNQPFWITKLARNAERDQQNLAALRALGWRPLVVWECETKDTAQLQALLWKLLHRD